MVGREIEMCEVVTFGVFEGGSRGKSLFAPRQGCEVGVAR